MADKEKIQLNIPKEQLQKLAGSQTKKPDSNSGNRFKNLSARYIATILGGFMVLLTVFGIILSWMGVGKIIEPLKPAPIYFNEQITSAFPVLAEAEADWNNGNLDQAITLMNGITEGLSLDEQKITAQKIDLTNLKYALIQENYSKALKIAQNMQAKYRDDAQFVGDVYYYKAHAYYYQKRYIFAVDSFDQAIRKGTRFEDNAHIYIQEIRDLLNH